MGGTLLGLSLLAWSGLWIPIALAVNLVRRDQEMMLRMARDRWAAGILRVFSTGFQVRGADRLDPTVTYLFVCNHLSHLDVPVLMRAIPFGVRFVAKHQLRRVPLLGRFIVASGMVFVDRSRPRQARDSLSVLASRLRSGQSFVAFPEGSRSRTGELGMFKLGAFKAAIEAGVQVVPVAIQGSMAVWPADVRPRRRGPLSVSIGQPRSTQDMTSAEARVLCRSVRQDVERMSGPLC